MAILTERVRFTAPADVKALWKASAAERGMSLSSFLRKASEDMLLCCELDVFEAELEFKRLGATI
jgi:hypothetical protein